MDAKSWVELYMNGTMLYEIDFLIGLHRGLVAWSLLFLFISLMTRLVLKIGKNHDRCYFRINTETIYIVLKYISEVFYALSIASISIVMVFYTTLDYTYSLPDNAIAHLTGKPPTLFIVGVILLILVSPIFRIFLSDRNKILGLLDVIIPIISLLAMFSGVLMSSFSYFSYIVN